MCDDHTPAEFGTSIEPTGYHYRLSIEPLGRQSINNVKENVASGLQMVRQLSDARIGDFHLFKTFQKHFLCQENDFPGLSQAQNSVSQLLFGFDFKRSSVSVDSSFEVTVKSYFDPRLRCSLDKQLSIVKLKKCLEDLGPAWSQNNAWIQFYEHFTSSAKNSSSSDRLSPVLFSVDCSDSSTARIKIYSRVSTFDLDVVSEHLALGGSPEKVRALRERLHKIWRTVLRLDSEDFSDEQISQLCKVDQGCITA